MVALWPRTILPENPDPGWWQSPDTLSPQRPLSEELLCFMFLFSEAAELKAEKPAVVRLRFSVAAHIIISSVTVYSYYFDSQLSWPLSYMHSPMFTCIFLRYKTHDNHNNSFSAYIQSCYVAIELNMLLNIWKHTQKNKTCVLHTWKDDRW